MAVNVNTQRSDFVEMAQGLFLQIVTVLVVLAVGFLAWYETSYVTDDKLPDTVVAILTKMGALAILSVWLYHTASSGTSMFILSPFRRGLAKSDALWRAWHQEFAAAQVEGREPPALPPEPGQTIGQDVIDAAWRLMVPFRAGLDAGRAEDDALWREWYKKAKAEVGKLPPPPPVPSQRNGSSDP